MFLGYAPVRKPGRQDEQKETLVHSVVAPEATANPAGVSEMG